MGYIDNRATTFNIEDVTSTSLDKCRLINKISVSRGKTRKYGVSTPSSCSWLCCWYTVWSRVSCTVSDFFFNNRNLGWCALQANLQVTTNTHTTICSYMCKWLLRYLMWELCACVYKYTICSCSCSNQVRFQSHLHLCNWLLSTEH